MPIQELGSIGELIAAIATVITLVYLAFQINQNTRAVKASVLELSGSRSMDLAKFVANDPELSRIVTTAMTHGAELEEAEKLRLQLIFTAAMRSYDLTLAHKTAKFLDQEQYSGFGSNLSGWVGASYFSAWWENAQMNFSTALQDLVREQMKNLPDYPNFFIAPPKGKPGE
jgi:hypothetical protein